MTPTDGAASACAVDSSPRAARVQTSAGTRALRFAAPRVPRLPARAPHANALVTLGDNDLVDLRVETVIRRLVEWALEYCGGNVEWAADELAVSAPTLRRWLKAWAREDALEQERPIVHLIERGGLVP